MKNSLKIFLTFPLMITIKYTVNGMRSLSGARSVELIGKHNDDDDDVQQGSEADFWR